jgi:hypothetical protein
MLSGAARQEPTHRNEIFLDTHLWRRDLEWSKNRYRVVIILSA